MEKGVCIGCGGPILDLNPTWNMCNACKKGTEQKLLKMKQQKKQNEGSPKRIKMWIPMLKGK